MKRLGKVDGYKYVQLVSFDGELTYRAEIPTYNLCEMFTNARDAALRVDLTFLKKGKEPPNGLLKRK